VLLDVAINECGDGISSMRVKSRAPNRYNRPLPLEPAVAAQFGSLLPRDDRPATKLQRYGTPTGVPITENPTHDSGAGIGAPNEMKESNL
jgi:hypothetical protein